MIGGEAPDPAVAGEVRAAVAEIADDRVLPGDGRRNKRRRGAALSALTRARQDRVVRFAHRRRERIGARDLRARVEKALRQTLERGGARHLAPRLAADAIGDGEQGRPALVAHEIAVFVRVAHAASVAPGRRSNRQG